MKNRALNTLKYTGIVTLSQCIGSNKFQIAQIHNVGKNPLFNFLTDCLIGNFDTARASLPTKIMLLKEIVKDSTTGEKDYESKSDFIYLTSKPEKGSSVGTVKYSFIVPRAYVEGDMFNGIGLYTNATSEEEFNKFAAFCRVDLNQANLSSSAVLVVDWELTISNSNS